MKVGELLDELSDLDADDNVVVVITNEDSDSVYQVDRVIKTVDEVALQVTEV